MLTWGQQINDIEGYWKSCDEDDNMVVRVVLDDNRIPTAHLIGFQRNDGSWQEDKPQKGIKVMYKFKYSANLTWKNGKIYDPITKRTYRGVIQLQSKDTIKATGYWAFLWDDILYKRITLKEADEPES